MNNIKNKYGRPTTLFQGIVGMLFLCGGSNVLAQNVSGDSITSQTVYELYGQKSAHEITSSISTVDSKKISRNTVMSFENALYGQLPGLFVRQTNGEPGAEAPVLYMRGKHTINGAMPPLVLVDGFPRDLNTLSVDEVESVSILKDAAATALYGMDGANGIILITTKRGVNQKTRISFKAEYGLMEPTRLPEFYDSYNYANFYTMAEENDGKLVKTYLPEQLEGYKNGTDPMLYPNVDWLGESLHKTAPMQDYGIDIRGGNQTVKFYVNLGYANSKGLYKEIGNKTYEANNNLDRFRFRSNLDVRITRALSMSIDLSGRMENDRSPYTGTSSIWNNFYSFHPNVAPIFAAPGMWGGTNMYRNNPVAYINDNGFRRTHRRLLQSNIRFNYDLSHYVKGLSLGAQVAFDNFYSVDNGYKKEFGVQEVLGYDETSGNYKLSKLYGTNSPLTEFGPSEEKEVRKETYEFLANYNRTFGNHGIDARVILHADSQASQAPSGTPDRRVSAGGKITYDYRKKYIVEVAASYGGGENFMRGKRFGWFPAISGAWILSKEKFLENQSVISFLKLRASTGMVGNQNVGGKAFGYRNLYSAVTSGWGAGTSNASFGGGFNEAAIGNPDLTWEKAWKTDVAVDITLWKHWSLMFNYYYEYRTDILNSANNMVPSFFGVTYGDLNYGKVASYGFESAITYQRQHTDWGYEVGLNVSQQKNEIRRMSEVTQRYDYLYKQGSSLGDVYGLVVEGYYTEDDVRNRKVKQSFGKVIPGSLMYKDVNDDGVVDKDDYQKIGKDQYIPEWELGLNLGINYKGAYLNANLQACLGRDINLRNNAPYVSSPLFSDRNISTWIKQPWTAEVANNPELVGTIDFPSLSLENSANNFQTSTFFLKNGNFLRLRSLEVGYTFPGNWIKPARLQAVTLYFRGMNLLTLDHIKSFDPEVLEGYPAMKSYNIGVNLTF